MGALFDIKKTILPESVADDMLTRMFQQYVASARDEEGSGGYSGTMAEACGLSIRRDLRFETMQEAEAATSDLTDKDESSVAVLVKSKKHPHYLFVIAGWYAW